MKTTKSLFGALFAAAIGVGSMACVVEAADEADPEVGSVRQMVLTTPDDRTHHAGHYDVGKATVRFSEEALHIVGCDPGSPRCQATLWPATFQPCDPREDLELWRVEDGVATKVGTIQLR